MKENFRLIVIPREPGDFGAFYVSDSLSPEEYEKFMMERCKEIKRDIMRHIDDVENVYITWDEEVV